jgi:ABC superfamily ATP binding cassette transporter, ABC protein
MIDLDRYKEILDTLSRNKTRSFLTGFGVFWGIFMLVSLLGGGKGLRELLSSNFKGFANNSGVLITQNTTKPYDGLKKDRSWSLSYKDIERLKQQIPEVDVVTPLITKWGYTAVYGDQKVSCAFKGLDENYQEIETPELYYGRYLNNLDNLQKRKVCILGKKVYKTLFPKGGNPCGKEIRVGSVFFKVVGVDYNSGTMNANGSTEESVVVPIGVMRDAYAMGDTINMLCFTGKPGIKVSDIVPKVRTVVARAHHLDPTDEKAMPVINVEAIFGMMDSLFKGVDFLAWLVGIGTLLAGAIGVSNIMMVTVKERTTEIGIRRAIGATPKNILMQIITESITLISVAGMSGVVFTVLVLQMAELASTTDGIVSAHYQISFFTAVGAVLFLCALGVLAGLAPALRAMSIKPVDAMRDE